MSVKPFFISIIIILVGLGMFYTGFDVELFNVPVSFIVIGIGAIVFEISLTNYSLGIDDIFAVIFIVLCFVIGVNFEYIYDLLHSIYSCFIMSLFIILPICLIVNFRKRKREKAQEIQRIEENLKKCINEQFEELWVKYEQAFLKNDYSDWCKERDCFLDDFVSKNNVSYHHLNTVNFDIIAVFDKYWSELVENKSLEK